ncbi:MAG: threonine synthase, partial [Longimicrobiales bacterium]
PVVDLGDGDHLVDLTRGPTAAFKDGGARCLAAALHALAPVESGRTRTVLVATSGDTGGAVAAAFHGVPGLRVVVLFPADGVSPRQRRQFTSLGADVTALGVDGPFDACQRLVKEALGESELRDRHLLTSANSINVGRLLPQATWFVKALSDLGPAGGPPTFVVPSGNLGHLTAGLLADALVGAGARFVGAVNDNDAFAAWLQGRPRSREGTVATPSTAMDVGRPSNLERVEALVARDPTLRGRLGAEWVDAGETLDEMRRRHRDEGRFVDPHTAVGLAALRRLRARGALTGPAVVLSTADPGKFPDTVRRATGVEPPVPAALADLDTREERWAPLAPTMGALAAVLERLAAP